MRSPFDKIGSLGLEEACESMEAGGSEGDRTGDGSVKPKRQMKTPFQLESLEKTYAAETYPSEATRANLSVLLGLTDRQLQMWFCHRRLKDKKEGAAKNQLATPVARKGSFDSQMNDLKVVELGRNDGSGSRSGSGSDSSQFSDDEDMPLRWQYELSPRSAMVQRVISCIEAQLGGPLREDGPIIGVDFDKIPPSANRTSIGRMDHWERSRNSRDGQIFERTKPSKSKAASGNNCEPDELNNKADGYTKSPSQFHDFSPDDPSSKRSSSMQGNKQWPRNYGAQVQVSGVGQSSHEGNQALILSPPLSNDFFQNPEETLLVKKRKNEDRIDMEVSHEKKSRRELEKEDLLRRKKDEQMKKEMEKQDRERRKEEERLLREKQRQEEKYQREERREHERREKFLQRELLKVERRKQLEEVRREREAAKQKIIMERAALRRIAKESLELIEDERLELMELAASSKGLPTIVSLDYESLQNLESFRDQLCTYPPNSVQLKKPFLNEPWNDSEENIGNLFMAWRFCNTFSDILGLWPFALDEFMQALHDYDSRLLAEIHIALIKLIIRDIEEGARTQCGGAGTNQYTAANPEGAHPQIVEGAFNWGFDMRCWKKHLNPLTWPEILRQFALSAGCGPRLSKEPEESANLHDKDEVKGCEDIVSMLRDGSAVENAVTIMKEKGLPQQRKSRNRLTPGTIKFAAYHILCLEGSKGLTLIELADKIQKSGLRDLSTSKTPDATVSVALSRDPTLFVRIAPLTYCVRPAFRKDPADGEAVIAAAREEIQKYVNGVLAEETNGDVEKDDDSESDIADGLEVDEISTPLGVNKISDNFKEPGTLSATANNTFHHDAQLNSKTIPDTPGHHINQFYVTGEDDTESEPVKALMEIDETNSGESWVRALTEGEYCDLCVEERLSALVVLISVVNEGNVVRAVLEDRLDAANALKKQMWSETQLGKRRMREEGAAKFNDFSVTAAPDSSQSQLRVYQDRYNEFAYKSAGSEGPPPNDLENVPKDDSHVNGVFSERSLIVHDSCISQIIPSIQHDASNSERSRMQLKSYIGHRAEEMHVYRSLPLGEDRRHNRYWKFVASGSRHDPASGRIFVELCDGYWRLIDSEEAFDALLMSLDTRGLRESHLHIMLRQSETSFKENLRKNLQSSVDETGVVPKREATRSSNAHCLETSRRGSNSDMEDTSSCLRIELGVNETEKINAFRRYQDLESWMWKECFNSSKLCAMRNGKKTITPVLGICDFCLNTFIFEENKCPSCDRMCSTFSKRFIYPEPAIQCEDQKEINSTNPVVSDPFFTFQIRMIKSLLAFVEVSVSSEAFQSFWTRGRKNWGLNLQNASSVEDILQILIKFEGGIKRDWLKSEFETTTELNSCTFPGKYITQSDESVPQLPWIPRTSAAVALRLFELESSIFYNQHQKDEAHKMAEAGKFELPTKYASMKDVQHFELIGVHQRENKGSSGVMRGISACRQVVSSRGGVQPRGRVQKKIHKSRSKSVRRITKVKKSSAVGLMQPGKKTHYQRQGHGYSHGPRTIRKRRETMDVEEMQLGRFADLQESRTLDGIGISPSNQTNEKWVEDSGKIQDAGTGNCDSMGASESDDSADATRYRHLKVEPSFGAASDRSTRDMVETSDDDVNDLHDYDDDNNNIDDVIMNDGSHGNNVESLETSGDYSDSSGME